LAGQTPRTGPRTPWGHPDLQGRWTNATITLLERPVEFGDREFFTEAEAAEYSKTALERFLAGNTFTEEAAISGEFVPGVWGRGAKPCPHPPDFAHRGPNRPHPCVDARGEGASRRAPTSATRRSSEARARTSA
jgi:hypothetical protein